MPVLEVGEIVIHNEELDGEHRANDDDGQLGHEAGERWHDLCG